MELRHATDDDLPELHATFLDAVASVFAPHRFEPAAPSERVFSIVQRHILETGTVAVAEDDDPGIVGFGSSWTALRARLRLGEVPGLVLCSAGAEPPAAVAPSGYLLF